MNKSFVVQMQRAIAYNPATGDFTWKVSRGTVKAGDSAGSISDGYLRIKFSGQRVFAHRLAWLFMYGRMPKDQIDHIDGDRTNNRITNLREVDHKTNHRNLRISPFNTSGVMGVGWHKPDQRWQARIKVDGLLMHLGNFADWFDAVCARKAAEAVYGFHKNHGKAFDEVVK